MIPSRREAHAAYYRANRDKWQAYYQSVCDKRRRYSEATRINLLKLRREYYQANRAHLLKLRREYCRANRTNIAERRRANKDHIAAYSANRHAKKLNATPSWLTQDQLERIGGFYRLASNLTSYDGHSFEVDHIVPLQGRKVCGLHVPWNLQLLTNKANASKCNRLPNEACLIDYTATGWKELSR